MKTSYITGISAVLPNDPVNNDEIENVLGMINGKPSRSKHRILKNNGINSRYYAIDPITKKQTHTNTQLTAEAVRLLSHQFDFPLEETELLVCGTSSPDQLMPNHALMLHGELKIPPCEVICTIGVCCSGVTAFKHGYLNVASGLSKNAVITASELVSNYLRSAYFEPDSESKLQDLEKTPIVGFDTDFLRWMLSDAAAAVLITDIPREDGLSLRIDWIECISYANEAEACMYATAKKKPDGTLEGWRDVGSLQKACQEGYLSLQQDARILAKNIILKGQKGLAQVKEKRHLDCQEIDWFLPHYSSEYFRQELYDKMLEIDVVIPFEKWFTNLTYKGNTGSASIFVILEELLALGKLKKDEHILCLVPESARFSYAFIHLTVVDDSDLK